MELLPARRFADLKLEIAARLQEWAKNARDLGECLREVQDNKWFESDGFADIGSWAEHHYKPLTLARVRQLIQFADVVDDMEENHAPWVPENERQARPLSRLRPEERKRVAAFISTEYEGRVGEREVVAAVKQVAPWRTGQTSKDEVHERRARERYRRRVENACKVLAAETDPLGYLRAFGAPEGAREALVYLQAMAEKW